VKSSHLKHLFLILILSGCAEDNSEKNNLGLNDEKKQEEIITELKLDERFATKDRDIKRILSDYEKPLQSYPQIWQDEAIIQKNGRLYRENITDEPFTGSVVESFEDGSISLQTSYYRGVPHGQQIRNFPNGQKALEVNFDQGVIVGTKSRWWPNGMIREEGYWSEGKYLGRRLWDQTGRLAKEEMVPQE
jgi:antitoxin component YwqK of YwqJK toxin-antitoxin module